MTVPFCVCVPARNEVERLPRLLEALAVQDVVPAVAVVLCINNSDDGSAQVARAAAARLGDRVRLTVVEAWFPPALAHAGSARGRAMDAGAALIGAGERSLLISTDADCRPPPGWIAANLAAYAAGADVIGGRIVIDDAEPLPDRVRLVRALWDRYWESVRAIEDSIDPDPHDPAPRHGDHTGASLALDTALYRAIGGVPSLAIGEDRALVAAAVAAGGRLVHPAGIWTAVSPRQAGRAMGGMAEDMRRLHAAVERGERPMAPALAHWRARAEWRRSLRSQPGGSRRIALEEAALPPMPHDMPLAEEA